MNPQFSSGSQVTSTTIGIQNNYGEEVLYPLPLAQEFRRRPLVDIDVEMQQYYIPINGCRHNNYQAAFNLEAKIKQEFLHTPKKVLLLLGNVGAGKTTFCQYFSLKLKEEHQTENAPLVLYIMLAAYTKPQEHVIQKGLKRFGFSDRQIEILRKTQKFIFILDGYDEIPPGEGLGQNLYATNQLSEWKAHVIFSCRSSYLINALNYNTYFIPKKRGASLEYSHYDEMNLVPFNDTQIESYIQNYLDKNQHNPEVRWKDWKEYRRWIHRLPHLRELITTPFLLYTLMDTLPAIAQDFEALDEKQHLQLTTAKLYDYFVQRYFERQEAKLMDKGALPDYGDIKVEFQAFSKALAIEMWQRDLVQVIWQPRQTPRFGTHSEAKRENEWADKFLSNEDKEVSKIREGCPLRDSDVEGQAGKRFGFLHDFLRIYFASTEMFQDLLRKDAEASVQKEAESTGQKQTAVSDSFTPLFGAPYPPTVTVDNLLLPVEPPASNSAMALTEEKDESYDSDEELQKAIELSLKRN